MTPDAGRQDRAEEDGRDRDREVISTSTAAQGRGAGLGIGLVSAAAFGVSGPFGHALLETAGPPAALAPPASAGPPSCSSSRPARAPPDWSAGAAATLGMAVYGVVAIAGPSSSTSTPCSTSRSGWPCCWSTSRPCSSSGSSGMTSWPAPRPHRRRDRLGDPGTAARAGPRRGRAPRSGRDDLRARGRRLARGLFPDVGPRRGVAAANGPGRRRHGRRLRPDPGGRAAEHDAVPVATPMSSWAATPAAGGSWWPSWRSSRPSRPTSPASSPRGGSAPRSPPSWPCPR